MKRGLKFMCGQVRFTNLEILMAVLIGSLTLYVSSIVPSYIKQLRVVEEERKAYRALIQTLESYAVKEEEWKEREEFLDLCLEGYRLDFPKDMDEYLLLEGLENYLKMQPIGDLEVQFIESQEREPFQDYIYKIKYVSSEKGSRDVIQKLLSMMEGIRMRSLHLLTSPIKENGQEVCTTECIVAIACQ